MLTIRWILRTSLFAYTVTAFYLLLDDGDVVSPCLSLSVTVRRRKREVVIPSSLISVFRNQLLNWLAGQKRRQTKTTD
jgi:hypothetical protein